MSGAILAGLAASAIFWGVSTVAHRLDVDTEVTDRGLEVSVIFDR
ncbi:hypothetical protein AB0H71_31760 [Nocardia sp. NPDC050697]